MEVNTFLHLKVFTLNNIRNIHLNIHLSMDLSPLNILLKELVLDLKFSLCIQMKNLINRWDINSSMKDVNKINYTSKNCNKNNGMKMMILIMIMIRRKKKKKIREKRKRKRKRRIRKPKAREVVIDYRRVR